MTIGTLFVVGTPIGNLGDLSPRAGRVLKEVALIAAEDTRTARKLLTQLQTATQLVSYHEHSGPDRRDSILATLDNGDVALISEAGSPGVSDPGSALVADAKAAGHDVVAVPGPSAVTAALSVSGMPADSFLFLGFLPRRARDRRRLLSEVADEERTLVAFEAPHRFLAGLSDLVSILGDRHVCVARELTKAHEEVWHGTLREAHVVWSNREPRGEFTLVVGGAQRTPPVPWSDEKVRSELAQLAAQGVGAREASRQLAGPAGRPAREVYRLWEHDK